MSSDDWVKNRPDKEGVYGVRCFSPKFDEWDQVVRVMMYDGTLMCSLHTSSASNPEGWYAVSDLSEDFEWLPYAPAVAYTPAMGEAAEAYLKRVAPRAHPMPVTMRWEDLFNEMLRALTGEGQ